MDLDYHILRSFADSWGLLMMVVFFVFVLFFTFRPSGKKGQEDAANIPFKE